MSAQVSRTEQPSEIRVVRFDRPLLDQPSWADPRMTRQLAEATRAAREQGLAEGYAAGWAQGRQAAAAAERADAADRVERAEAARQQFVSRTQPLLAALAQAGRTLTEQAAPAWDELVEVLLDGALRIAAAGLGRELAAVDVEVLEAARTALRLLPAADTVTLHVNPADAALLPSATDLAAGLTIVVDPTVPASTVVARSPVQSLPINLRTALRAAEEVLHP